MNIDSYFNPSVFIALILFALLFVLYLRYKRGKYQPNYSLFFILGATWTSLGIVLYTITKNIGFFVMGIFFLFIGLINRDKWIHLNQVTPERKVLIAVLLFGFLLFGHICCLSYRII